MAPPTHPARRTIAAAALAFAAVATPAEASIVDPRTPHSPNAHDMVTSYWVMLAIAAILVVAVNALLVVALVRFRERRERQPARTAAGRGAFTRASAGLAALALAVLVFGVIEAENARTLEPTGAGGLGADATKFAQVGVRDVPPINPEPGATQVANPATQGAVPAKGGPLVVDAVAQQWLWRFEYPGNNPQGLPLFSYGELVVPVDTAVLLNVTSTDVLHTWWVPNLGGQVQAVPGTVAQTWFKADQEGIYRGASTTFSGTAYPTLRAWVKVVSPEAYEAYVERLQHQLERAQSIVKRQVTEGVGPIAQVSP